jgi:hypothetical protein
MINSFTLNRRRRSDALVEMAVVLLVLPMMRSDEDTNSAYPTSRYSSGGTNR